MNTVGSVSWKTLLLPPTNSSTGPGSLQKLGLRYPYPHPLVLYSPPLGNMATWRRGSFPSLSYSWRCWFSTLHFTPVAECNNLMIEFLLVVRKRTTIFVSTNVFCCSFGCRINYSDLVGHRKTNIVFNTFEEAILGLAGRSLTHLIENGT